MDQRQLEQHEYILEARELKAKHFATVLKENQIPISLVQQLDHYGWELLTKFVNWRFKSSHGVPSVTTEEMIYALMLKDERYKIIPREEWKH